MAVSAGDEHTCALLGCPGQVMCWGDNSQGQLGIGSTTVVGYLSPTTTVVGLGEGFAILRLYVNLTYLL